MKTTQRRCHVLYLLHVSSQDKSLFWNAVVAMGSQETEEGCSRIDTV